MCRNSSRESGAFLGLDEDESETLGGGLGQVGGVQQVEQEGALVVLLHPDHLLGDVLGGGADAAHRQEDVVIEEVAGQHLDGRRERRREHEGLTFARLRHRLLLDDAPDLQLEAHVQHAVGLVEHQVAAVIEPDAAAVDHVEQPPGGGHQQVAAAVQVPHLVPDVGSAVSATPIVHSQLVKRTETNT
jgi:hypothetical protein